MTLPIIHDAVFGSAKFREILRRVARDSVVEDLTAVVPTYERSRIDWNFAIFCCSALTSSNSEADHDAVLRVAQRCLNADVDVSVREAAALLLERLGNRRSIDLATSRGLVDEEVWTSTPPPLQLDIIRRRLELSIPVGGQSTIAANSFQRQFWTAATRARWVSVSAPTSAGKSYIVRRWIGDLADSMDEFRAVYLVPTRALIEEVSNDLRQQFTGEILVHTMPWSEEIGSASKEIFVLTQERYHLLQHRISSLRVDILFIDEAQKFGDGERGILLQAVVDETVSRDAETQLIFASPQSENPEVLLEGAPVEGEAISIRSEMVTVNQNLLWANQDGRSTTRWRLSMLTDEVPQELGYFDLPGRPHPASKRLPFVAVALGGLTPGNVVYVNGSADAEKAAEQIFDALGADAEVSADQDLIDLAEMARVAVHEQYALARVLSRGVGFHYGNMPQLLRGEIERLFREEKIRYLVCTSTLLEGVNLPCRNLFVRGPKKGHSEPMSGADFWNLAGRAGRWGTEFQGNIVCIDSADRRVWPSPPTARRRQPLTRASDAAMRDISDLLSFIGDGAPLDAARANPLFEAVFSLLGARQAQGRDLTEIVGLQIPPEAVQATRLAVARAMELITVPPEIVAKHANISPLSMQRLLDHFSEGDVSRFLVSPPEGLDAAGSYLAAFARIDAYLGAGFGTGPRGFALAITIVQWMRGFPLSRLISERIRRTVERTGDANVAALIRATMKDVEEYARYRAPKFLACYLDLLRFALISQGRDAPEDSFLNVSMMLELGVSRMTEMSLMELGASRTTTVALSEYITNDQLSAAGVLEWLRVNDAARLPLPAIVRRELRQILERGTERESAD